MNSVVVVGLEKKFRKYEVPVRRRAFSVFKVLDLRGVSLEIYLVDDPWMRQMSRAFFRKNKVRNILSFAASEMLRPDLGPLKYLGEIYLNPHFVTDWVRPGPRRRRGSFPLHLLLAHGILHLLGYGHKSKRDRIRMEKIEKRIIHDS